MKFFFKSKDGGPDSNVTGYWLIESKKLFSIVLLCFNKGSREAFHSHAFNAISWVLSGRLNECTKNKMGYRNELILPSIKPIFTPREKLHKVTGLSNKTWVITFRGPWSNTWKEFFDKTNEEVTLTSGRKIINKKALP